MNSPAVLIVAAVDDLACGPEVDALRRTGLLGHRAFGCRPAERGIRLAEPECKFQLVLLCESRPGEFAVESIDACAREPAGAFGACWEVGLRASSAVTVRPPGARAPIGTSGRPGRRSN